MNKNTVPVIFAMLLTLSLSACGSNVDTDNGADTAGQLSDTVADTAPTAQPADTTTDITEDALINDGEMGGINNWMRGIFFIENTELAIDADTAAEMLPLWKAYRALIGSDTTAQAEIEALTAQIGAAFSSEQLEFFTEMDTSNADLTAMMEELGIEMDTARMMGNRADMPEGVVPPDDSQSGQGGGPGSGTGTGGGPGSGGTNVDPEVLATRQAERESPGLSNPLTSMLLDPLIELLESKLAG